MPLKGRGKLASLAGSLVLLAACGSSTGGGTNGGNANVRGVTDTSVTIGGLVELTSPGGAVFPGADIGAKARFARANKSGGIAGRMINYVGATDDASSATQNLTIAKQLVQQDHVFAVVPVMSATFLPAASNFLAASQVPFFGWAIQQGWCDNTWAFGYNGCLQTTKYTSLGTMGPVAKLVPPGSTVAIQSNDSDPGKSGGMLMAASAQAAGLNVVYNQATMSNGVISDYTPYANTLLKSANGGPPAVIITNVQFANVVGLDAALKGLGYTGKLVDFTTYVPGLLSAPSSKQIAQNIDGAYQNIEFGPQEQGGPAISQITSDLTAIGEQPFITIGVAISYWAADMLVQMLQKVGKDLTPATFQSVIDSGSGFTYTPDPPGAVCPLQWPQGHSQPAPGAALTQASGTKYTVAVPFTCYSIKPSS
jgi:branched-chain amino acid transport system substrate-binding protein